MTYTVKDVINEVRVRANDLEGKISSSYIIHLINRGQEEIAKKLKFLQKEKMYIITSTKNAVSLPNDLLDVKNLQYAEKENYNPYLPGSDVNIRFKINLKPMSTIEIQSFQDKIFLNP